MREVGKATFKSGKSGIFWLVSGSIGQSVIQFCVIVILARLLIPSDFGVVTVCLVLVNFVSIFSQLGVGPALIQKATLDKQDIGNSYFITLIISFIFSGLLYFFANELSSFFNNRALGEIIPVFVVVVFLSGISIVAENILLREFGFRTVSMINFLTFSIVYAPITIVLARLDYAYFSLAYGVLAQSIVRTILFIVLDRKNISIAFDFKSAKELLMFGFGHTLARIFNFSANNGDKVLVAKLFDLTTVGAYSKAFHLMKLPVAVVGNALDRVLFPIYSSLQGETAKISSSYQDIVKSIFVVTIPVSVFIFTYSSEIVFVLLGDSWSLVAEPLAIFAWALSFRLSYKASDAVVKALGAVYNRAAVQLVYLTFVILGVILGTQFGLLGVSIGVSIAILLNFVFMMRLVSLFVPISWFGLLISFVKIMLTSLIPLILISSSAQIAGIDFHPLVELIVTAAIYFGLISCFFWKLDFFKLEVRLIKRFFHRDRGGYSK
jgi:PST family polysaccharide transporter